MNRTRIPALVLVALLAGALAGIGLGGAAHTFSNDPCSRAFPLAEGSTYGSTLDLWPFGLRCEYHGPAGERRTARLAPSVSESLAWMTFAALLAGVAMCRPRSAPIRGLAAGAAMIALLGVAWQWGGFIVAFWAAVVLAAPLVFALDLLLAPADRRSRRRAAMTAVVVVPAVFVVFACFDFSAMRYAAVAAGVLAGSAAAAGVERWEARRADLLPCD